jgi:isopenicillin-N epimerase
MVDRRAFLASSLALGGVNFLSGCGLAPASEELPQPALHDRDPDAYWASIRRQFLIPADVVYLNNGSMGSSPRPVLRAIYEAYEEIEQLSPEGNDAYPFWGYGFGGVDAFRDEVAGFVNCARDEIALVRSATEAINVLANGLDIAPGDEVLMTDQEHDHGEEPWNLKARRYGTVVRKVSLPHPVESAAQVLQLVDDAITPRTRVLFFSHVTTDTGTLLPAKELCALARSRGLLSFVDGAQFLGMMRLDVADLGCDAYCASGHKWLQGPKGTGFLYIRNDVLDRIWNTFAGAGWDDPAKRAMRFQQFGTGNMPCLWGLSAAIRFAEQVGVSRIERRQRELADELLQRLLERGVTSWTSPDPACRSAMVTVHVPSVLRRELQAWLWSTHRIRIRGSDPSALRLSTAYYVQPGEINRFLEKFDEYQGMSG